MKKAILIGKDDYQRIIDEVKKQDKQCVLAKTPIGIVLPAPSVLNRWEVKDLAGKCVAILPETAEKMHLNDKFCVQVQVIPFQGAEIAGEPRSISVEDIYSDASAIIELQKLDATAFKKWQKEKIAAAEAELG